MNLYSPDQIAQLQAEFPTCDVPRTLAQIEQRAADEPVRHPMSFARSWLRRESEQDASTPARPSGPRGTLRADGHWYAQAEHESDAERIVRDFIATLSAKPIAPRYAVDLIRNKPELLAVYREPNLALMLTLDASEKPTVNGPFTVAAWVDAAWAAVPTSTSAEQFVKAELLSRWKPILRALYYPAEAALEAATAAEYGVDDYPDNGSAW